MVTTDDLDITENEIRFRVQNPDKFSKFRYKEITEGVSIVVGKLKDTDKWETQAYRFNRETFSPSEATEWLNKHDIKYEASRLFNFKNLTWKMPIHAQVVETPEELKSVFPHLKVISITGTAIDDTINANEWSLSKDELPEVAQQLIGKQLTINHSPNIEDVMGKITDTKTFDNHVDFTAEIMTEDSNVLVPILSGNVDSVSIEADAESSCSVCGKNYIGSLKPCRCSESHPVIRNVKVERLSIVANPAYKNTKFVPVNFAAAIKNKLNEGDEFSMEKTNTVKVAEEEKVEDVTPKDSVLLKEGIDELKKLLGEAIPLLKKFGEKKAEEEEKEPEEKKEDEDKTAEKKETSKKIKASTDKTKSMALVDTSHDNTPPKEVVEKIASKDTTQWMAELINGRKRMDNNGGN